MISNFSLSKVSGSTKIQSPKFSLEIPKIKKQKTQNENYEHSHRVTQIEALSTECFECMECSARFEFSDQLLQHLDTHRYFEKKNPINENEKLDCSLCNYSLKSIREELSEEEIQESLKKHTILEHFNAKLPQTVMDRPVKVKENEEPERGINNKNIHGTWKCDFCPRSFDQTYQLKIHKRYYHTGIYLHTRGTFDIKNQEFL